MKKLLLAASLLLASYCAVNAQGVPGVGAMVPNSVVPIGVVQNNTNSSSAPTANNDSTQGYSVGSLWQNSATAQVWIARSVAVGAAVWTNLELSDFPGYIASNWYEPFGYPTHSTGAASTANSIRIYPGWIKERITLSNLGARVITNAAGNVQLAIYANNPATGRPTGNALVSTASMSTATAGTVSSAASIQLEPGLYWFAGNTDTAGLTFTTQVAGTTALMGQIIGSATQGNVFGTSSGVLVGLVVSQTFGTWPSLTAGSFTEIVASASVIGVQFQVNSIP